MTQFKGGNIRVSRIRSKYYFFFFLGIVLTRIFEILEILGNSSRGYIVFIKKFRFPRGLSFSLRMRHRILERIQRVYKGSTVVSL